jgi:hypothetical protein
LLYLLTWARKNVFAKQSPALNKKHLLVNMIFDMLTLATVIWQIIVVGQMMEIGFPAQATCTLKWYAITGSIQEKDTSCLLPWNRLKELILYFDFGFLWLTLAHNIFQTTFLFVKLMKRNRIVAPAAGGDQIVE